MLWAVWIAGASHPSAKVLVIFVPGTVAMRSAGCVINDLADRDFDPFVKRTRDRPIASRRIAPLEAVVWFLVLIGAALALVLKLDESTIRMSVIGAVLAVTYPLFKRFFPLPQFYLGVAFSWGVPMAFDARPGGFREWHGSSSSPESSGRRSTTPCTPWWIAMTTSRSA